MTKRKKTETRGRPREPIACSNGRTYDGLHDVAEAFNVSYMTAHYAVFSGKTLRGTKLTFWKKDEE